MPEINVYIEQKRGNDYSSNVPTVPNDNEEDYSQTDIGKEFEFSLDTKIVLKELMLSDFNMMLFCIYFYAINMNNIRNQYIIGTGIWWKLKYSNIAEAFGNVILKFILELGFLKTISDTVYSLFVYLKWPVAFFFIFIYSLIFWNRICYWFL